MNINLYSKPIFLLYLFVFILMILLFYFQTNLENLGFHNLVFTDGYTHSKAVREFINGQRNIFEQRSAWFMPLIYSIPSYLLGTVGVLIFNNLIIYFFYKINLKHKINILTLLFFTPFYFFSSFLPNKENPVLFLVGLYLLFIYKKKYFLSFIVAVITFSIRDGQGMLLIIMTLLIIIKFPMRLALVMAFSFSIFIDSFLREIADITKIFVLQRTLGIIDNLNGEYLSYPVRIFATVTNLGSRSIIYQNDHISLTGLSFYLAGIGIFIAFILALYEIVIEYNKNSFFQNFTAILFLFSVILFSISPLIQPRYIIPMAFLYLIYNERLKNKNRILITTIGGLIFLILLRIIYLLTIGLPETDSFFLDYNYIFYGGELLNE